MKPQEPHIVIDRTTGARTGRTGPAGPAGPAGLRARTSASHLIRGSAVILLLAAGYFAYAVISRDVEESRNADKAKSAPRVVQLDVLNGCGVNGVAAAMTSFLRTNGFDVVEMKNYKSFSLRQTVVVDRVGNLASARQVASALGLPEERVIQEINRDYFVDVTVIIGADYASLASAR